jgi:hypothetical protein
MAQIEGFIINIITHLTYLHEQGRFAKHAHPWGRSSEDNITGLKGYKPG